MRSLSSYLCRPSHVLLVALLYYVIFGCAVGMVGAEDPIPRQLTVQDSETTAAPPLNLTQNVEGAGKGGNGPLLATGRAENRAPGTLPPPAVRVTTPSNLVDSTTTTNTTERSTTTTPTTTTSPTTMSTTTGGTSTSTPTSYTNGTSTTTPVPDKNELGFCLVWNTTTMLLELESGNRTNVSIPFELDKLMWNASNEQTWSWTNHEIVVTLTITKTVPQDKTTTESSAPIGSTTTKATSTTASPSGGKDSTTTQPIRRKYSNTGGKVFLFMLLVIVVSVVCFLTYIKCSGSGWDAFKTQCSLTGSNFRGWYANRREHGFLPRGRENHRNSSRGAATGLLNNDYELL